MLKITKELYEMFTQINKDCMQTDEQVVDITEYSNIEYYTNQIKNIYDVSVEVAYDKAYEMWKFSNKVEAVL